MYVCVIIRIKCNFDIIIVIFTVSSPIFPPMGDDNMFDGEDPYGVMCDMLDKRIEEGSKSYINTSMYSHANQLKP